MFRRALFVTSLFFAGCSCDPSGFEDRTYACTTDGECVPGWVCERGVCTQGGHDAGGGGGATTGGGAASCTGAASSRSTRRSTASLAPSSSADHFACAARTARTTRPIPGELPPKVRTLYFGARRPRRPSSPARCPRARRG